MAQRWRGDGAVIAGAAIAGSAIAGAVLARLWDGDGAAMGWRGAGAAMAR
jgi:hypothetical protein